MVAAIVLVLCVYASIFDDGNFKPEGLLKGGIPTYFLAKGLFCSSALFILGRVLLSLMTTSDTRDSHDRNT